jgi:hypothetical protein
MLPELSVVDVLRRDELSRWQMRNGARDKVIWLAIFGFIAAVVGLMFGQKVGDFILTFL